MVNFIAGKDVLDGSTKDYIRKTIYSLLEPNISNLKSIRGSRGDVIEYKLKIQEIKNVYKFFEEKINELQ